MRGRGKKPKKGRQEGIPTTGVDVPIGLSRSGVWNARVMRNDGRRCGALLLKKGRGDSELVLFSHDRKGGNCKRLTEMGKGRLVGER